jgi:hypothetical protein
VWNPLGMQMMEIHIQELLHPEATERLAREVGGLERRRLGQYLCRWLCGFGRFLVALGRRLQQVGLPPAVVIEEQAVKERRIGA